MIGVERLRRERSLDADRIEPLLRRRSLGPNGIRPRVWRGEGGDRRARGRGFDEFGARIDPQCREARPPRHEVCRSRPGEEAIRRRAYEIHLRNGRDGNAVLDWLEAEQQLLAELRAKRASGIAAAAATLRPCPLPTPAFSSSSAPPAISRAASFFRRSTSSTPRGTCRPRPESSV